MSDLVTLGASIPPMSIEDVERVRKLEGVLRSLPQVQIATEHVLHAGMYTRTIRIPPGVALTGVLIRIPTMLVINGDCTLYVGDKSYQLHGYHVFAASARRRQAFLAHSETCISMSFATQAKTVGEAEDEFTDEPHLLFSRHDDAINHVHITGD